MNVPMDLHEFARRMPKTELHVHLEGSIRPTTLLQLARRNNVGLPAQVQETYGVLLSKPFWIWGCEMGVNERGVAIGNEAVFSKVPAGKEPGLIGMDFIRLALERADTARKALEVIVKLLKTHGQSGNCGRPKAEYYHNAFIIADPTEAWVLETVAKFWVAEKVRDVRTISNGLTIGNEWDMASSGLVEYASNRGWCKSREDFHFARCFSDFLSAATQSQKTFNAGGQPAQSAPWQQV